MTFLSGAKTARILAVDTETTGLDQLNWGPNSGARDRVLGISLAYRPEGEPIRSAYFPISHKYGENIGTTELAELCNVLGEHPFLVAHNALFDQHALSTLGIRPRAIYCTLIGAQFIDEEAYDKSLDGCAKKYLKDMKARDELSPFVKIFGWEAVPVALMRPYAEKDAELHLRLAEVFIPMLKREETYELWLREAEFQNVLYAMEQRGIQIDREKIQSLLSFGEERMDWIELMIGFDPKKSSELAHFLFEQMRLPVLEKTPTGKPKMSKKEMEEYDELLARSEDNTAQLVLEYRGWLKSISSYYRKLLALADSNGVIHPHFRLTGTRTGRLSCADPNLQQIPRESDKEWAKQTKQVYVPRDGYSFVELDYSQLEFRLCASYANESALLEVFNDPSGRDIFTEMSVQLGMARQDTKTLTYSLQYGAGINRIKTVFGVSDIEAANIRDNFYTTYPGISRVSNQARVACMERGYVRYWNGRRRHLPKDASNKAFNSVLQGGAAELVKSAMLKCAREICDDSCYMLLQVHDAIVFEIKTECVEEYSKRIRDVMTDFPQFKARLAVDAHSFGA